MAESVFLIFAEQIDRRHFADLVVSLGGVTGPGERGDVRLSDGSAHVWVHFGGIPQDDPEELAVYRARLGVPPADRIELEISRTEGSEALALRIIEAAAHRWTFVVDNGYDEIEVAVCTPEELMSRSRSGAQSVLWPSRAGNVADSQPDDA